ncbi:uncharacterized protein LOC142490239 [Ascaphus truei]|uniref:uncharacterized protein LOC142490239 n=1 Tax=Ascaphus truei TaxID=8439 RepID=UPI003F5AA593
MGQTSHSAGTLLTTQKKRQRGRRSGQREQRKKEGRLRTLMPESHGIFNLSSFVLSAHHTALLSKGLSFAPSSSPKKFNLFVDLNKYIRKVTLMRFFTMKGKEKEEMFSSQERECIKAMTSLLADGSDIADIDTNCGPNLDIFTQHTTDLNDVALDIVENVEDPVLSSSTVADTTSLESSIVNIKHSPFIPKSTFFPYQAKGGFIDTFYTLVLKDFESLCQNTPSLHKRNLHKNELQALKELSEDSEIVIRQADKGGGIVLQDKSAYIAEANRLLGDVKSYIPLQRDPMDIYQKDLKIFLLEAKHEGIITQAEFDFLFKRNPRTPVFYHIPKIHKDTINPPGRPIVSGVESMTSSVSQYVDHFLQPMVVKLRSHIRDTLHVIDSISGIPWKSTYIWATCDVASLYTCIGHTKGVAAIAHYLDKDNLINKAQRDFILDAILFILEHNYFLFGDDYYLQICGTAMGTRFAPSYANLYMGLWEDTHVWGNAGLGAGLVYYGRFIDDLIFIWDGEQEALSEILTAFNDNQMDLRFTFDINKYSINFLDLELMVNNKNEIVTKTFFKKVSTNAYLHFNSNHYHKWLENVPRGQFLRIRRNCSLDSDYLAQGDALVKKFVDKGYNHHKVLETFKQVGKLDRQELLDQSKGNIISKRKNKKRQTRDKNEIIVPQFITQFNCSSQKIKNILNKHWGILLNDPIIGKNLPPKIPVIFQKARNIKSIVAPSRLKKFSNTVQTNKNVKNGNFLCNRSRCLTCKHLKKTESVTSHSNGSVHQIKGHINCLSTHIVYAITCPCGLQYIGRTKRALCIRFLEHRRNIIHGLKTHSLSRHYELKHNKDPSSLVIMGVEAINSTLLSGDRHKLLNLRETYWIYELNTLSPEGLNDCIDVSTVI